MPIFEVTVAFTPKVAHFILPWPQGINYPCCLAQRPFLPLSIYTRVIYLLLLPQHSAIYVVVLYRAFLKQSPAAEAQVLLFRTVYHQLAVRH
jgi:hypothetical protein